ncbi:hypothetical protein Mapa_000020 [Marchantia paleacea]|nr:hypothetical protein Mapa_000020 [Marchantia paleacea]
MVVLSLSYRYLPSCYINQCSQLIHGCSFLFLKSGSFFTVHCSLFKLPLLPPSLFSGQPAGCQVNSKIFFTDKRNVHNFSLLSLNFFLSFHT